MYLSFHLIPARTLMNAVRGNKWSFWHCLCFGTKSTVKNWCSASPVQKQHIRSSITHFIIGDWIILIIIIWGSVLVTMTNNWILSKLFLNGPNNVAFRWFSPRAFDVAGASHLAYPGSCLGVKGRKRDRTLSVGFVPCMLPMAQWTACKAPITVKLPTANLVLDPQ